MMADALAVVARPTATDTPTVAGETTGIASQYTFGTFVLWGVAIILALYVLYRRFQ